MAGRPSRDALAHIANRMENYQKAFEKRLVEIANEQKIIDIPYEEFIKLPEHEQQDIGDGIAEHWTLIVKDRMPLRFDPIKKCDSCDKNEL